MNNLELASIFNRIAALSELKGENVFVVRAYQRAAQAIQYFPVEVEQYVCEGKDLKEISGIGDAISQKIHELLETGRSRFYEELESEFPNGLTDIMEVPGVGPKSALRFTTELGVESVQELEEALEDGRVEQMPGFGAKAAGNMLRRLRNRNKYA